MPLWFVLLWIGIGLLALSWVIMSLTDENYDRYKSYQRLLRKQQGRRRRESDQDWRDRRSREEVAREQYIFDALKRGDRLL